MRKTKHLMAGVLFAFCYLVLHQSALAQKTYSGKIVSDKDQTPLSGVTVSVKGKQKGTASNNEGRFSIDAETGDVLIISGIDLNPVELTLADNTNLVVKISTDIQAMNEVVVTAL